MLEKQTFIQIVDIATGNVERVTDLKEIEALSVEEKLALARTKTLYVVSHKLEPVIKVEMRKVNITPTAHYDKGREVVKPEPTKEPEQTEIPVEAAVKTAKGRPRK